MKACKKFILFVAAAFAFCHSCVEKDYALGGSLIPSDQQYDIYTAEFDITEIGTYHTDSLSGYSTKRMAVGAVRDPRLGLNTRSSIVTLVPIRDSLDFGKNAKARRFHFTSVADSSSVYARGDERILQNINVYELTENVGSVYDINADLSSLKGPRATEGPIICNGADSLSFDFTNAFAQKYIDVLSGDMSVYDSLKAYTNKLPGIYIDCDAPSDPGGRINLFELQFQYNSSYAVSGNYAELSFTAEYDGQQKDTSFLFWFSPAGFYDVDSLVTSSSQGSLPQYCLNLSSQQTSSLEGAAAEKMYVEGGGGLKPVISSAHLRDLMKEEIGKHCSDPSKAVINRASIILPYEYVYEDMYKYPIRLSPTCRIRSSNGMVAFASLTDSSDENEDQGNINRSLKQYAPDITYHAQSILRIEDGTDMSNYDIWMLIMAKETYTSTTSGSSSSSMSDYYNALMYASYYNNMYGGYGGYGGYGYGGYGYGSYGYDSYSNYYSYYLMSMLAASSSSSSGSTSTAVELDTARYYDAVLYGPACSDASLRPKFRITYAVPKNLE